MQKLNLITATALIEAAFQNAERLSLKPLAVAILDQGGHLIAFQKQDNSSILRFEIASGKAYGALALGVGSRWLNTAASERLHFVQALSSISGGRIVPVPGGVLVRNSNREILGAVGISGDTSDNDEACAVYAIEQVGLISDKG